MTSRPHPSPATPRPLYDPATGEQFGTLPDTPAEQCAGIADRAAAAFPAWAGTAPRERAAHLRELAGRLRQDRDGLIERERRDAGKPVARIGGEVEFAARALEWFAGQTLQPAGEIHPGETGVRSYTDRIPLGVVAAIAPSNYPLLMASWKIAGALAHGNTVVVKPSPDTPRSVQALVGLADGILPPHVLSAVYGGAGTGRMLCELPQIAAVSFTGSTAAGRDVAARCAGSVKRVSLELGGKNPLIVFPDADLEAAAQATVEAFTGNTGQMCVGASRLVIHEHVHDAFVRRLLELTARRTIGPTDDPATDLGPLTTRAAQQRVHAAVEDAAGHGAKVHLPPGHDSLQPALPPTHTGGFYVTPVVLDDVPLTRPAWREELSGPVLSVTTFRTEAQALHLAHDTDYGLSASVWTTHAGRAEEFARRLRAGMVWVNTWGDTEEPVSVGGIGHSGYGRELGVRAADQYTHTRAVWIGTPHRPE
ncbi:aldehyde dehydrogenase family protein, partial [Actinacidiphila rubida]